MEDRRVPEKIYLTHEVAVMLDLCEETIRRLVKKGRVSARKSGLSYAFTREGVLTIANRYGAAVREFAEAKLDGK